MTTRSRFSRCIWTSPFFLAAFAQAQSPAGFPLLKSCGDGAEVVATVLSSDEVKIRYSFATDGGTCYAVVATVEGQAVNGYLAGGAHVENRPAHPAIVAFEQEIRTHVPEIPATPPPPPPAPPAPAAPGPPNAAAPSVSQEPPQEAPQPLSFAGFRAVDVEGNRVDLGTKRATNIVVYFWSADTRGIKRVEGMENIFEHFHTRGVDVVGVASARSAGQLRQVCRDNEVGWSVILDYGGIATRYHVDPAKPFLLLDQSRRVMAAVSSPGELESILVPLTQRRRETQ